MSDLFALIAFVAGVPMFFIGYIWALVVSKRVSTQWMLANIFILPMFGFFMMHWHKIKVPFIIMTIGIILVAYTLGMLPE